MQDQSNAAAIGFRVKSGWAAAVALGGSSAAPRLLTVRKLELCDPAVPESRQPYHEVMEAAPSEAAKIERRLCQVVEKAGNHSVGSFIRELQDANHRLAGAGVVVGSDIDPNKIANTHIRAHAQEGRLFRLAVENAVKACGLKCETIVERNAYAQAAVRLGLLESQIKRVLTDLGRAIDVPWRADEKMAALAAWMQLG